MKTNVGKVYFVDASANTFEHVLAYLRRGVASWPDLADDPKFYQRLVAGAEYFGLGGSHAGRIVEFCTHCGRDHSHGFPIHRMQSSHRLGRGIRICNILEPLLSYDDPFDRVLKSD